MTPDLVLKATAKREPLDEGRISPDCSARYGFPMHVQYGDISAWCSRCGCRQFQLIAPQQALAPTSVFECYRCSAQVVHGELIGRIGDEAMRRAQLGMATLRERHTLNQRRIALLRACRP